MNRKTQGKEGVVSMKIDMSKAFDRVNWDLVKGILSSLGFCYDFVNLIFTCISIVEFSVLQEGVPIGSIKPQRGLRQGDPLSPYLFILSMEGLSALIHNEELNGGIHGLVIAKGAPPLTHLFFADDCLMFCRANSLEANILKATLAEFSLASGQVINFSKSSLQFSKNVDSITREVVGEIMGIQEGNQKGSYLGLPSLIGRRKSEILGFIKGKIMGRIKSWNNKFLSRAGREILIKNVLQAIPTYAMSIFHLPMTLCRSIEIALNDFWWCGQEVNRKGIRWRAWSDLCKPKSVGGMGFRSISKFNVSLLGKQAWRILNHPNSLVSKVFKAKYFKHSSFLEAKLGSNPSYVWHSILEAQAIIKANSHWRVGNGSMINIWKDPWLPDPNQPFIKSPMLPHLSEGMVFWSHALGQIRMGLRYFE